MLTMNTDSAGVIFDTIPTLLRNQAISDEYIKLPGDNNKFGGVKFTMTMDNISLVWDIISGNDNEFEITYSSPNVDDYVNHDEELPFTETLTYTELVEVMEELTNYLLDKTFEEE